MLRSPNLFERLWVIQGQLNKACLQHFGMTPDPMDIRQKLHHILHSTGISLDIDHNQAVSRIHHIIQSYCNNLYPRTKRNYHITLICNLLKNPSKPLPLP
jgi:hypothetical protein